MILEALVFAVLVPQTTPVAGAGMQCYNPGARPDAVEFCLGNNDLRQGESATKESARQRDLFTSAANHFRRSADTATDPVSKAKALDARAVTFDVRHLNQPAEEEQVVRELIATVPTELAPMFRLADLQDRQGELDAAEETLLAARHREPDSIEPYKRLAQFYAKRAVAMQPTVKQTMNDPSKPTRDENGVLQVGGPIQAPQRLDRAVYPPDAQTAGVSGDVVVNILIDGTGNVADAKVMRSVPLLDDSALQAVHNWHFQPTMMNGQAVPVRMNVTVSFTLSR
jgi:TonB family protein